MLDDAVIEELERLQQAIAALEAQRSLLGEATVETALGPMRARLGEIQRQRASQNHQQRKQATLLFMDIAGHTALIHHLDPEEQVELMDQALRRLAGAVEQHGGRVVRFQGDGFKAVFGLPTANEYDPDNAIRAGLAIQAAAREISSELEGRRGLTGFAVRVGIATGLVLGGGDGSEGEAAVGGEPVNLAARLESAAQPGTVLIAHATYQHVRGVFDVQPLEPIQAKGFAKPVQVYRVLGVKPHAFRTRRRGVEGVATRMVGRDRELGQLQATFSKVVTACQAQTITVVGEPGIGKSRLLYEFEKWVDLQPARARLYRGRARLETRRLPYGLLRDLFAAEFEIHDSDSEAAAIQKLEQGIMAVGGPEHADWAPFIGHVLGFNFSAHPAVRGILEDAQQIRDRAFYSAVQYFAAVLQRQPVLILLEDIHWADEGSLDFFQHLAQACPDRPLLIVGLARSTLFERRPGWGAGPGTHVRIDLVPLTEGDSQRLVGEVLQHVPEIPDALHAVIVSRAEGNPFYVEEVIKMLIDDGVIVPGAETWHVRPDKFVAGKIPPTLTGVLQARLDGLPAHERRVLNRASVSGRIFWDALIARMKDPGEEAGVHAGLAIGPTLSNLRDRELIFRRDQATFVGTTEYLFNHALLRDVTYESVLKRLRRAYHAQVAAWLCDHGGERVEEYAGRIGEHYELAGALSQAAEWYVRAGRQAQDTYAPELAQDYYHKALALWEQADQPAEARPRQVEVYQGLGQVLNWLGRYAEAVEAYQRMAGTAERLGNALAQAHAWHGIAEAQMHKGDTRAAIESAGREEALARTAGGELEVTKALWMKAWGAFKLGEIDRAQALAERVASLSQSLGVRDQMAHSLNLLGVLHSISGRFPEAARQFEQALEIFRAIGNRRRAMPLLNNLGVIAEARGDDLAARALYQEALAAAREMGNRDGEMVYLSNLGGIQARLGESVAAEADLRHVIHMAGAGGLGVLATTYSFLAEACLGQGKLVEALASAQQALALAEAMESQEDLGLAWRTLGRVAAARREPIRVEDPKAGQPRTVGAEACFAESEQIFRRIERQEERARTLREWAKCLLAQGHAEDGRRLWDEARAIFAQLGAEPELARMEAEDA